MHKKGLFSKMAAAYTIIIAVSFVIVAAFLSLWFQGYYFEQRKEQITSQSAIISDTAIRYVYSEITPEEVSQILGFIGEYLNADIWLVDDSGYVYAVSNVKHQKLLRNQLFKKDIEILRNNSQVERRGMYNKIYKNHVHTIEIPILTKSNKFIGAVIIHTPMTQITEPLKKVYQIIWISALLAIVLSCIVIYLFSQKIIIKPLAQINTVARKIAKGEVEKQVNLKANDEIGELAESFNSMADSLEKVEENRRQFISNVSHEIRSPITSIKGFIGGIVDGIVPPHKENHYLSLAYEETERLTRLVNDLLDLSALESGKFSLIIDELDLNEIIRLTVLNCETKIKYKKLKVDVSFDNDKLYVLGDRDRLIQVMTNLLDNAIKYANEGGNIKISSKTKGKKAIICFFNDGPGIKKEDLKHIWERFYKADKARTSKVSTGLGLSIVRGIISQLGEDIWIENKEEGVSFKFTLTRAK